MVVQSYFILQLILIFTVISLSNKATNYGGAIYFTTVTNCNISVNSTNNTSPYGGAIYFNNNVSNSNVSGSFVNNTAEHGGAINFNRVDNSNVSGCYVNNKAKHGGAIHFGAGGVFDSNVSGRFDHNTAQNYGGAICFENRVSNVNINGSFVNNIANFGGAIFAGDDDMYDFDYKKSVHNSNISGCYVNNTANYAGGAINFRNRVYNSNISGCYVNNTANYAGGAINFDDSVYNSNVRGCYVNNIAKSSGGAINFMKSVYNSNVGGCYVNNIAKNMGSGGAIEFNEKVSNSNVSGCYVDNTANYGGAIYFGIGGVFDSNVGGYFEHNTAQYRGGAIEFNEKVSNSNVSGCYVNNKATEEGGAIYFYKCDDLVIQDSIFINNNGDIIYVNSGNISAINCWFGNNATNYNIKPKSRNVEMANWLFLNATANTTEITIGQTSSISFKLYAYNETSQDDVSSYNSSKMDIILKLSQTLGELNQTTALIGENLSYTAKKIGNGSVTGEFKTAYYTINLKNNAIPTNITVNTTSLNLIVDENATIGATLNPPEAGNLTFTSNDTYIATVDANGVVKAIAEGTAIITVSFPSNEIYASAENKTINITVKLRDASVSVNNSTLDLLVDDTFTIVAATVPEGLNVTYVPDDSGVYSIDEKGVVTALKNGTGYVLVKVGGDGIHTENSTTVTVTVSKIPTKIKLTEDDYTVYVDDTYDNLAVLQDNNGNNITDKYTLNYSYDNESIVKIVNSSFVAVGEGIATITVSFNGTDKYGAANDASFKVSVFKIPTNIYVAKDTLDVKVLNLTSTGATLSPGEAGNLTYASNNETIAVVLGDEIVPRSKGTAVITVSFAGNDKYAAAEDKIITVNVSLNDASVSADNDTINLFVENNYTINATTVPTTPQLLNLNYTSSIESVATVDADGVVIARGEGTAIITVEIGDDLVFAKNSTTVTVTLIKIPTEINIANATVYMKVNDEVATGVTLTPADAGNVTYTISNSSVVKVKDGKIIALAEGEAII
ncbi:Ig domain-containing protein, partial [Methanobrevibacter sp.]|uniref:Ig-like domain-containing protein n=1 Tax=Methanobrevibacter sp. TaxID=66852 RepID=UPI00388E96D6